MKKILFLLVLLSACGGGTSSENSENLSAQLSPSGIPVTLYGIFDYESWRSSCEPDLLNQRLALYYNEDESYVMALNRNDEVYVDGTYSSTFTISYSSSISDGTTSEVSDCIMELIDGDCDEVADLSCPATLVKERFGNVRCGVDPIRFGNERKLKQVFYRRRNRPL